jgi:hypothetical protein
MSYSDDACTNRFSALQIGAMQSDLTNFRNNLLSGSSAPYAVFSTPTITYPGTLMYSNDKEIRWNGVPGAEYYLIEITPTSLPFSVRQQWFTTNTSVQVTFPLVDAVNYTVKITPYNAKNLSGAVIATHQFTYTTALGVDDIDMTAANFEIGPNPSNNEVSINVAELKRGNYSLSITNITGQSVLKQPFEHNGGTFNTTLRTAELNNGIYFLKISSSNINYTTKLVVKH